MPEQWRCHSDLTTTLHSKAEIACRLSRSRTDCGEVINSEQAQVQDEPVLRAELDLDTLGQQ